MSLSNLAWSILPPYSSHTLSCKSTLDVVVFLFLFLFVSPVTVSVSLSLYDTVSVFPSIFLPSLSLQRSPLSALHLSARVIEPCALSLSAKRLADRLHFHAEGCEDSVAVVRVIDWDPSQLPPLGSYYCLSSCLVAWLILSAWTKKWLTVQSNTPTFYISVSRIFKFLTFFFSIIFWMIFSKSLSSFCEYFLHFLTCWWINKSLLTPGW